MDHKAKLKELIPNADDAEYIGRLEALYNAVNEMMAPLGAHGEIYATDDRVLAVMDALHEIDGGVYAPLQPNA